MSTLGAIETPVATADARSAAGAAVARGARRLRVVGESMPAIAARAEDESVPGVQPRSSSIRHDANRRLRADLTNDDGPAVGATPIATPILIGTVVLPRAKRSAPAASVPLLQGPVLHGPVSHGPVLHGPVSQAPLRLTRRGRIVVAVLLVVVLSVAVLLITTFVSGRAQATNHGQPGAGYQGMHQVVVRPGQTLWAIAVAADPTADPRDTVQEIMSANALGSPSITAGQLLWIP